MKSVKHVMIVVAVLLAGFMTWSCEEEIIEEEINEEETFAPLIYDETFEGPAPFSTAYSKEVGDWDYALQFVGSPVYRGSYCARFEIRIDQPLVADGKRSEVVLAMGPNQLTTKEAWYSFAAYFPSEGYQYDHAHDVISQWPKDGSPVRLLTERNKFWLDVGNDLTGEEEIEIGVIAKDTWHEFIFHFIHSHESDGLIEVWHNGVQKVSRVGLNMYTPGLPKWKIGLYKIGFENGTADVASRIIFFDNIKMGDNRATFKSMNPGRD